MGCRSGITRRIQSSMSAWLSDGTGGFRAVFGLRGFANLIPSSQNSRIRSTAASDSGVATAHLLPRAPSRSALLLPASGCSRRVLADGVCDSESSLAHRLQASAVQALWLTADTFKVGGVVRRVPISFRPAA